MRPISFIKKLIRMHLAISKKMKRPVDPLALSLKKLIEYNSYNHRQEMSFFIRKKEEIYSLIPGPGCRAHKKLLSEYHILLNNSKNDSYQQTVNSIVRDHRQKSRFVHGKVADKRQYSTDCIV